MTASELTGFSFSCPLPDPGGDTVLMAHGGGGSMSHRLFQTLFLPAFDNPFLRQEHDGAIIPLGNARCAFTTDSYVVQPIFFPGGDIGTLAVHGTVNDLAMCGALPKYLSAGCIIEEGFPLEDLRRVVASMQSAAAAAEVLIVTGDTKVVDRGKGDKIFINTAGIGLVPEGVEIGPGRCAPGDLIIASGFIGEHGIAILSARDGIGFETAIASDTAPLHGLVASMLAATRDIHVLRDPTRGGVASALNEIARSAGVGMEIEESALRIRDEVRAACELLGLDPLYIANEGILLAFAPAAAAEHLLDAMRRHPRGGEACVIGRVTGEHPSRVVMNTTLGTRRVVDMLSGEQLPRIC